MTSSRSFPLLLFDLSFLSLSPSLPQCHTSEYCNPKDYQEKPGYIACTDSVSNPFAISFRVLEVCALFMVPLMLYLPPNTCILISALFSPLILLHLQLSLVWKRELCVLSL
ncbi:unnamed protein product, partial [Prunus brigantina]